MIDRGRRHIEIDWGSQTHTLESTVLEKDYFWTTFGETLAKTHIVVETKTNES